MDHKKTLTQAKEAIDGLLAMIRQDAPHLSGKFMGFAQTVSNNLAEEISKDEADQFWSEDNPEDGCNDAQELADSIADNMCAGDTATVKVWCSKRLPSRLMFLTVTEENDCRETVWRWVEHKETT